MNREMDLLIRILLLEGVAGVKQGDWSKLPDISVQWWDLSSQPFLKNLKQGIAAGNKGVSVDTQEEVLQNLLGLRPDRIYGIGQITHILNDVFHMLNRQGYQRMTTDHRMVEKGIRPPLQIVDMPQEMEIPVPSEQEAFHLVREILTQKWNQAPGKLKVILTVLDHPSWSHREVAIHLGKLSPCAEKGFEGSTYVSRVVRMALAELPEYVRNHPTSARWTADSEWEQELWAVQAA